MKKILFAIVAYTLFIFSACEKTGPGELKDLNIDLIVRNSAGSDLLNDSIDGHFNKDKIKLFYLVDDVEEEFYYNNYDCPRNFCIYKEGEDYIMSCFPLSGIAPYGRSKSTTILEWEKNNRDTLISSIFSRKQGDGSITYCDTVWVNGIMRYPNSEFAPNRKFILIK